MKKSIKRIVALLLAIVTIFSLGTASFAASSVSSVNCQAKSSIYGGKSVYFYIKANSTSCKLNFTCGKGTLDWGGERVLPSENVRGAYKVTICKWNPKTSATVGSNVFQSNIINKSSYTASFKATKGSYYRVQVYFFNATTTANNYWKSGVIHRTLTFTTIDGCGVGYYGAPNWVKLPTIKATNNTGCILYTTKP